MSGDDSVAVFWDYENCELPSTADSYSVASMIRQVAHKYGVVKVFKAYAAVSEVISPRLSTLRSELTACGVSFVDCPHNGRKDVADKMMIVDMMAYAMDTPAPATIVLISGDRDFAYPVALLRLRKYRIVVIAPNAVHASLKAQASHFYDWSQSLMATPSRSSATNPRPSNGTARYPEPPSPSIDRVLKAVNALRSSAPVFVPTTSPKEPALEPADVVVVERRPKPSSNPSTAPEPPVLACGSSSNSAPESSEEGSRNDPTGSSTLPLWTTPASPKPSWSPPGYRETSSSAPNPVLSSLENFVQRPPSVNPSLASIVSTPLRHPVTLPTSVQFPQPLPSEIRSTPPPSHSRPSSSASLFKPLLKILQAHKQEGLNLVSSSDLGTSLIRASPSIYARAGVTQLKKYLEMAQEQGFITMKNGVNGNSWVGLPSR